MIPARIVGILLLLIPTVSIAKSEAELCDTAAATVARNAGIPSDVLLALTRVETGRNHGGKFAPWPWTVNMEGKGYWFDTRVEAVDFVTQSYAKGARSFDVGCFQINHRWHGNAFTSFNQMFEPLHNATYAAKFLTSLYQEGGSWSWAAGAYHSRTEGLAVKYRTRFDRIFANLKEQPSSVELPIVVASNDTEQQARLSTWSPFQPLETTPVPSINGSLAGGLIATSGTSLLIAPRGGLF
jgi:hypothetical protein